MLRRRLSFKKCLLITELLFVMILLSLICFNLINPQMPSTPASLSEPEAQMTDDREHRSNNTSKRMSDRLVKLDAIRQLPIIFIGGFGRSGTTLLRAILDVHPSIYCGPEPKIVLNFLSNIDKFTSSKRVRNDLIEAGIDIDTINEAAGLFIYYILRHRQHATSTRLCVKEPLILTHMPLLSNIFPRAQFVHIVRDGRAAAYSLMLKMRETNLNRRFTSYYNDWAKYVTIVDEHCGRLGPQRCMQIKYEDLVSNSTLVLPDLVNFLNETWTHDLLEHEKHFNDEIVVSKLEWSTLQIQKKINNDSLTAKRWRHDINYQVERKLDMRVLKRFGYDVSSGDSLNIRNNHGLWLAFSFIITKTLMS